jgi:glyoxylase-like metal-dependent hydrolase (beta-lactamase superfamily II)
MILARSQHETWLSNSFLVGDEERGEAVVVDAGAPAEPILAAARERGVRITRVVLTHHHHDHVENHGAYAPASCCAHADELPLLGFEAQSLADGDTFAIGRLRARVLHVPGHTVGQLNLVVEGDGGPAHVFTGDTLFRGSVGGTRAPGHGTFAQLRASILDVILKLPPDTVLHPGHSDDTSVARELAENPFVRAWRGIDAPLLERCTALGAPATLLTWARDYDGGFKAWVRFVDGREDTVGGSRVERRASP